jgi:DNA-binding MurR/RpiR family transcriptional regulator
VAEHQPGEVIAGIRAQAPSLLPTERAVAAVLLDRSREIVELSSQQVADLAGASRATVVRACQSLGFSGYQQLRVLLARDAVHSAPAKPTTAPDSPGAIVTETFNQVGASVNAMTALLEPSDVARAVTALVDAARVTVIGNGLSAPLATDAAARLTSLGRLADAPTDAISQQISARLSTPNDVLLIISGSGANESTMRAAQAGATAGATIILLTSLSRSPIVALATVTLVVGMPDLSFEDEITVTTRIPQVILLEGLMAALTVALGEQAQRAKSITLEVVSNNLAE